MNKPQLSGMIHGKTINVGEIWVPHTGKDAQQARVIGFNSNGDPVVEILTKSVLQDVGNIIVLYDPNWVKKPVTRTFYLYKHVDSGNYSMERAKNMHTGYYSFIKEVEIEVEQ